MDAYEATRVVLSRIQSLDPENAHKIIGLLLLQENGEQELIRLAFGPETLLQSVVLKARKELLLPPPPQPAASPYLLRQSSSSRLLATAASSPPSWAPSPVFSRSHSAGAGAGGNGFGADELPNSDELVSPGNVAVSPFCSGDSDLIDEFHLPDQLSFLDDLAAAPNSNATGGVECRSPGEKGDGAAFPGGTSWGVSDGFHHHRRSSSAVDLCLSDRAGGFGWKPCLYYARGFCKNGTGCRFLHGLPDEAVAAGAKIDATAVEQYCHELLLRSKSQRIAGSSQFMASAFPYSPTNSVPLSPSLSSSKCFSSWLQQQQQQKYNESQRAAAAAAVALDEIHKLMGRSRMERSDLMTNPAARQIYLTFPADSTFSEEDVSNYFSIYGPVQDVRIPYQQKRMFGFVTFVYPETVRLILAKGNPHFVCDSRVLVKPYKEKGKAPDKFRKQQPQAESYDLQHLGARMLFNNGIANHDLLLRRKLEEQQQAAELQRAIELQGRRFVGLQLLDLDNRSLSSSAPASINSPATAAAAAAAAARSISTTDSSNSSSREEDSPAEDTDPTLEHQNCKAGDSSPPSMEAPLADHEPSFSLPFPAFA